MFKPSRTSSSTSSAATNNRSSQEPQSLGSHRAAGKSTSPPSSALRTISQSRTDSGMSSSPTQPPTPIDHHFSFEEPADACSLDREYWIHGPTEKDDEEDIEVSDALPTPAELEKAGDALIYDANGVARPFKSLYKGVEHQGQRQMIIFVRHFYCGACQHYLRALTETITPSIYFGLPTPTTISIIGCGRPDLIPKYTTRTTCPFRVYADPSRKLYKILRMGSTVRLGKRPDYMDMNAFKLAFDSFYQMSKEQRRDVWDGKKLVAGPFTQIGGEFLFEHEQPVWCHRMRNVRDHTGLAAFRKVLEYENEEDAESVLFSEPSMTQLTTAGASPTAKLAYEAEVR